MQFYYAISAPIAEISTQLEQTLYFEYILIDLQFICFSSLNVNQMLTCVNTSRKEMNAMYNNVELLFTEEQKMAMCNSITYAHFVIWKWVLDASGEIKSKLNLVKLGYPRSMYGKGEKR